MDRQYLLFDAIVGFEAGGGQKAARRRANAYDFEPAELEIAGRREMNFHFGAR